MQRVSQRHRAISNRLLVLLMVQPLAIPPIVFLAPSFEDFLVVLSLSAFVLSGCALWLRMFVHWRHSGPENRLIWLFVLILGPGGALLYFLVRFGWSSPSNSDPRAAA